MSKEEYNYVYPHQFKDELDKWLFREFGISGGACSSIESMRYSLAREVAEKAMEYVKQEMTKDAVDGLVYAKMTNGEIMVRSNYFQSYKLEYLDKVKLIIIKED